MKRHIEAKLLPHAQWMKLPKYATCGSAALDLRACLPEQTILQANETKLIGSGIAISIQDPNLAGMLLPRSGLGTKYGIILANCLGLIDSDYKREIKIAVWNSSDEAFAINPGDRLCQMVFVPIVQVDFKWVDDLQDYGRGGFGSTGVK